MTRNRHEHFTEDEMLGFILEELPEDLEEALEQHLWDCHACTQQLDEFYAAQETFPSATWALQRSAFVTTLRQQVFGPTPLQQLVAALQHAAVEFEKLLRAPQPKLAAPATPAAQRSHTFWTYHDPEQHLSIDATEEQNGDWTFRFESQDLRLENTQFLFCLRARHYPVTLQQMTLTEVGAKVVVRHRERPTEVKDPAKMISFKEIPH